MGEGGRPVEMGTRGGISRRRGWLSAGKRRAPGGGGDEAGFSDSHSDDSLRAAPAADAISSPRRRLVSFSAAGTASQTPVIGLACCQCKGGALASLATPHAGLEADARGPR